jgi:SAM-dependent methyltransferase
VSRWDERDDVARGDEYDARWTALADAGESIHGEADLISTLLNGRAGASVLDAGCGTGRVGIELAQRGFDVVGTDLDPGMLDTAKEKASEVEWVLGDLVDVELDREFDLIAMPGNVMIFVAPGTEGRVLGNLTRHLRLGALLVAGFTLRPGNLSLADYDMLAAASGLALVDRWSTWDQAPFTAGDYAVSLHARQPDTLG